MRVGLFVTCLADLMRPERGLRGRQAARRRRLQRRGACGQTCCGQPALNSGDSVDARDIAQAA